MSFLRLSLGFGLCVALLAGGTQAASPGAETGIFETASGRSLSRAELLQRLAGVDYLLLGELHDNAEQHRARGLLIRDLARQRPGLKVVAEHLELGRQVEEGGAPLERLSRAGFDPKGWRWPAHEPLFAPLLEERLPLLGGNIPRDEARRIVREGQSALRPSLAAAMQATPLGQEARAQLEASLLQGHCGQMPERLKAPMVLAQEAKDAAMARGLLDAGAPAVLVAGNGHVRRDYGVPRFLPGGRSLSVGFLEQGRVESEGAALALIYDYVWVTPAMSRDDPCLGLKLPAAEPARAVSGN